MAQFQVNMAFNADTGKAKAQIQELQSLLSKIAYTGATSNTANNLQQNLQGASQAAKELQIHLNNAFNASTGHFDLSLLDKSLKASGTNIQELATQILSIGPDGQQAFMKLAKSISLADQPMLRVSKRMQEFATTMKNTVKWQLSSSLLHSFMGAIQSAYGYAQNLNKSLNDIRIVTGYNTDQMAEFAEQANKAAKALSTTTTDYTKASLIYYQQGLPEEEITERTNVTIKMANAAGVSAETASDQLTAVWNNFYDGSKSLEYYADVMTALGAATASSTDEISEGLSKFAAVADTVGLSYEYATAALATVTAETRESADIVGNSFKAIFGRLQGLSMGETLEDGITLNKYSEALATIGVSILDSNNELKQMDDILEEIGARWIQLSEAQQVALANTIGGTQQYARFIALMDNWDKVQENLNIAYESEGALQEQADIYAQSWEAAEKRVRAAMQGIYQSLIDDEFFITLNNVFASSVNGLGAFIKEAGGVKTVISGIGGVILSIFAHKIPEALDTAKYNLEIITRGTKAAYENIQTKMEETAAQTFNNLAKNTGITQDSAIGFAITQANKLTAARNKLALVSDKMNLIERQSAELTLNLIQTQQEAVVALKQKNEAMQESIRSSLETMKVVNSTGSNDFNIDRGLKASAQLNKHEDDYHIGLMSEDIESLSSVAMALGQTINEQIIERLEQLNVVTEGVADNFSGVLHLLRDSNGQMTDFGQLMQQVEQRLDYLHNQVIEEADFHPIKKQVQEFINILPTGVTKITEVKKALYGLNSATDVTTLLNRWKALEKVLDAVKYTANDVGIALEGTTDSNTFKNLNMNMRQLNKNLSVTVDKANILTKLYQEFNPASVVRISEALGSLTGMTTSGIAAVNTFISVFENLGNASMSGWEKTSSALLGLISTLGMGSAAIKDFTVIKAFLDQSWIKSAIAISDVLVVMEGYNIASNAMRKAKAGHIKAFNDAEKALLKETMAKYLSKEATEADTKAAIADILWKKQMPKTIAKSTSATIVDTVAKNAQTKATWQLVTASLGLKAAVIGIAAVVGVVALLVNNYKSYVNAARASAEQAREAAAETKKQVESNQELVDSYGAVLNAYEKVKEAFSSGQATTEDLTTAQENLEESALNTATALGVEGAALAKLSGNYEQLTKNIFEAQKKNIQQGIDDEIVAKENTGSEFITYMREGKGYFLGSDDQYYAEFWGGLSHKDETFFKTVDYSQFNYLQEKGYGDFIIKSGQDLQSLIAAYEEAQKLYNQAQRHMTAEEMNKSENFQKLKNYLKKSAESYKAYKTAEENIQNYQIQIASLTEFEGIKDIYDVSNIEEYDQYTSAMIKNIAKQRGILDENGNIIKGQSEAYEELTKAVYAYLGSLEGVSDLAIQSKAFDEIAEKTGIARDELVDYYNRLNTSQEKELFFKISFNRDMTEESFNKELQFLKTIARGETIKIQLEAVATGLDLLNNKKTDTDDIVAWAEEMENAFANEFDLIEYLGMSPEKQKQHLLNLQAQSQKELNQNRTAKIQEYNDAINQRKAAQSEQEELVNQNRSQRKDNLDNLTELQQYKNDYNLATSQGKSFNFATLGKDGITDIDSLNDSITATQELINENDKIINSYNELGNQIEYYQQEIENLKIEEQVENAYGWREAFKGQADAADIAYEDVQEYANILRESNDELKDNIKLSEKLALQYLRTQKGVKKISDSFKDWTKIISKKDKDIIGYSKAMDELKEAYQDVFNTINPDIIANLDNEFLSSTETMSLMQKALNGTQQDWDNWEAAVMRQINITTPAFADMSEDMMLQMNELTTMAANLDFSGLTPGADIQDAPFISKLQQMEFATAEAAQAMCDNLSAIGVDAEWVENTRTVPGYKAETTQKGSYVINTRFGPVSYEYESGGIETKEPHQETFYTLKGAKYNGRGVRPSVNNSNSGGGSKQKHEKKSSTDKTRYHTLENQLEDLKSSYDDISKAAERAFGRDKIDLINGEIEATDDLIAKQEEYLEAIESNLAPDRAAMEAYYNELIGGIPIEFDASGNISNYDAIQDAMYEAYNQATETYANDEKGWEVFEKKYEQLEKYIEQYEETYDLLRDEESAYQELLNQRLDLELEKVQYSVELKLNIAEDDLSIIEYQFDLLEDKAFASAERITSATEKANNLYNQMLTNRNALEETLGLSLSDAEIAAMMSGDMSVLNDKTFTEDQINAIRDYRNNLLELNTELIEIQKQIEEEVITAFEEWHEELDQGIAQFDHYNNLLESYKNIIDIVGKDILGLDNEVIANLSQTQVENSINQLESLRKAYEGYQSSANEAQEKMLEAQQKAQEAENSGNQELANSYKEDAAFWEETYTSMNESAQDAQEAMMDGWGNTLEAIASQFEVAVERAVEAFNNAIYQLGGLERLSEDFSRQKEMADMYLDDYQQIYELSKLSRDINNSIDDTENLGGKQKLKKLLEEINKIQEEGVEMSQYDLEYLQKTYDLRLAEIELEEAQKAKDTVRLSRDNEGNWSYVYTQNTDAVDAAQQKYEDALYAMQDLSSNYIDEMSEKLITTSQEMAEAIAAVRIEDYANIEDYYAEIARIEASYQEQLTAQEAELQKAIDNNRVLYEQDWMNYSQITGYKISAAEDFAQAFSDTLLGSLIGSEEATANFTNIVGAATDALVQGLAEAAATYYANLNNAMEAAGTSTSEFADLLTEDVAIIEAESAEAAEAIAEMADKMDEEMTRITNRVHQWQEDYGHEVDKIINKNLEIIESFNAMLEALSIDPSQINVSYDIISNPEEVNIPDGTAEAATGMYTGEWGDEGRVAVVHEKELILNQNDTANMLQMLYLTRYMLSVIDTNARQLSMGMGTLQATTLGTQSNDTLEQQVSIVAEFPNVTEHNEIEEAFNDLINRAAQYAHRK